MLVHLAALRSISTVGMPLVVVHLKDDKAAICLLNTIQNCAQRSGDGRLAMMNEIGRGSQISYCFHGEEPTNENLTYVQVTSVTSHFTNGYQMVLSCGKVVDCTSGLIFKTHTPKEFEVLSLSFSLFLSLSLLLSRSLALLLSCSLAPTPWL